MPYLRQALFAALCAIAIALGPGLFRTASIDAQTPPAQTPQAPARTVQDGVYSDAQASRGQALYAQRCAGCHGPALEGAQAPPLAGEAFVGKFRQEPLSALFIKIRYTMPPAPPAPAPEPGQKPAPVAPRLTPEQGADLVAHLLKTNGLPAGKADFPAADATASTISWPARTAGSTAAVNTFAPAGTVNQLMRGIFFHNSNLIFAVQETEPANLPPPPPPSRPDGLTTFDWGMMVYTGWPAIENSAAAIADASALLLQPGLRCENGRLAPITEPDWIRFTERMVSVAKRTQRLAQTQDKDAVSEFTADLSNACNACHSTYRDVGGRGRGRGGNAPAGGGRCVHR
jgi:mono/diheme cytochrome c family protein